MTPGPQSLELLMQRAQARCDQAVLALQRSSEAADQARLQHEQLLDYRAEYEARWSAQFQQGGTMDILLHYRSFMQRLDQALQMQARQAAQAEARLAQARHELLDSERRVASVRKLLERRQAELAHAGRRREQKQTDELAQRMRWQSSQRGHLSPH
jgi:flagellar FliJ protein